MIPGSPQCMGQGKLKYRGRVKFRAIPLTHSLVFGLHETKARKLKTMENIILSRGRKMTIGSGFLRLVYQVYYQK